jgi:hypothetical protein
MIPILPVRQNPHFIAQPTCVERQNVLAGVSGMKTDLDQLAVFEAQQELGGAVRGFLRADHLGRRDSGTPRQAACAVAAEIGHSSRSRSRPRLWTHWKSCRA